MVGEVIGRSKFGHFVCQIKWLQIKKPNKGTRYNTYDACNMCYGDNTYNCVVHIIRIRVRVIHIIHVR